MRRLLTLFAIVGATPAGAQTLDPRSFVNTPVGINFVNLGAGYQTGNVLFDPAVPITNATMDIVVAPVGYARALDLWGLSGKVDGALGWSCLDGSADDAAGARVTRQVCGLTDPTAHVSVNFIGAPALTLRQYPAYHQKWLVGAGFRVTAPLGQYDPSRLVNIGTNRWAFRTELAVSRAVKRWTLELLGAGTFYTANDAFLIGTQTLSPLWSVQMNVIYTFKSGIWGGVGFVNYRGGEASVNGGPPTAFQQNGRAGATLVFPLGKKNSVKAMYSSGVWTRTGTDFDFIQVAWVHLWGGKR